MTKKSIFKIALGLLFFIELKAQVYKTPLIEVEPISANIYVHRSFLFTRVWGKVPCNGMIYIQNGEAIVFDTPVNDSASVALFKWVELEAKAKVKAVVINHFHEDCLGGLRVFHDRGVPSYSSTLTQQFAQKDTVGKPEIPQHGFEKELILTLGNQKVINTYWGKGHTSDNITSYIPNEEVLFGGCLIKEIGAKKGNLADATVGDWGATVARIKQQYSSLKTVVPGHGKYGDMSLLDYTIKLFQE
ncbi:subclass B1 metallo-beta-lactamase [Runella sp. MFBS21]|uniref:subclass B1 metallo-beta-lactamase n=1 Tax=Runella sp. MFBS21 TaxID=3034018 RepID=UPI0023F6A33C|nr:subclass B1 metallo-beta-lactamase [Runella sp. MFBS21]MDF7818657.1 subclass B1 metallo-beta-lactamase [Runella sp. MFBS21]